MVETFILNIHTNCEISTLTYKMSLFFISILIILSKDIFNVFNQNPYISVFNIFNGNLNLK